MKLTKQEVEELQQVINKGKHTSQSYRVSYILLNVDDGGELSLGKLTNDSICKVLKGRWNEKKAIGFMIKK